MAQFDFGKLYMTRGVDELGSEQPAFDRHIKISLARYLNRDWGDMCADDKKMNDDAVEHGENRIFAAYKCEGHPDWKIWIITEHDRSYTTILFPSEY